MEWGCPFLLYWELYCNEIDAKTSEHRGYWLIDNNGDKQPAWYLHRDFLGRANAWLDDYMKEYGKLPEQSVYNAAAAKWLEPVTAYQVEYHN